MESLEKIGRFNNSENPGFLLWQAASKWRRLLETALKEIGLTHPQLVLLTGLGRLNCNRSFVSQIELARYCRLDVAMTSQILRILEKRGYVAREMKEGNERSKFPVLTASGARLIEKAIPIVEAIDRRFFEVLGADASQWFEMLCNLTI